MLCPTGLIPWFSKTEGNTYATLLHHPFLFKGKPTHAQVVARRISGAVAGEICAKSSQDLISRQLAISGAVVGKIYAQVKTYQVPITNSYPSHYIIFHSPLVFLSPTSPLPFYSPFFRSSLFACFLCACVLDCLSRWLKTILNCVTFPIPTTMILLALRFLLLPDAESCEINTTLLNLVRKINFLAFLVKIMLLI